MEEEDDEEDESHSELSYDSDDEDADGEESIEENENSNYESDVKISSDNELEEESIIVQRMNAFLHRNNINREDNTCTVCFENTEYKTKCGHYLCFQCRVKLIEKEKSKTKCPYCRQKLYKKLFKDFENDFCFDTNNNLTEDEEESDEE